jgi:hypothetical protein
MSALDTNGPFEMEVVQEETPEVRTGMQGCRSMKAKAFWYPSWAPCGHSFPSKTGPLPMLQTL